MAQDLNKGVLFKNKNRTEENKQPNVRGEANIDGIDYWVSAWTNTAGPHSQNPGMKFQSLSFEKMEKQPVPDKSVPNSNNTIDDDIPF